jgi:membrane protein YqaA with SNARE-associated domain
LGYFILFLSAFGAATILPFYSEIAFIGMLEQGFSPFWVWLVATAGNSLGAAVNWILGRYLAHFEGRRWFPFKPESLHRSQAWFQKYGVWSLLLAWLPIGGDALTFIAGVMRVRFSLFFVLTAIGKGARYAVLYLVYSGYLQVVS